MRRIFPNILTMMRVLAVPIIVVSMYIPGTQYITLAIFLVACATDFLDGALARTWSAQTRVGSFTDQMADKLIVSTTLVMLVYTKKISGVYVVAVIVIMCRELVVSCMREFFVEMNIKLPVNIAGKTKTAIQMIAIALILADNESIMDVGRGLLVVAAVASLYSLYVYVRKAISSVG